MTTDILNNQSEFGKGLEGIGRILEDPEYNVWGCSPIYDKDGRVHVFFSRWLNKYNHLGWVAACEVAHAVADKPEGPYEVKDVVLKGRGGDAWDSWSIHNPSVYEVDGKYIILYMGSDGSKLGVTLEELGNMGDNELEDSQSKLKYFNELVKTQRVGMAIADDLNGPWERVSDQAPIIDAGKDTWDSFCVSNPTFVVTPENNYRIYYKSLNTLSIDNTSKNNDTKKIKDGNRQYGFAEATNLTGKYIKYKENPILDYSYIGDQIQVEDAYIWREGNLYKMILRDMGIYNHEYGLYIQSEDGINWDEPKISFLDSKQYIDEKLPKLTRQGRFERPQLLLKNWKPDYLFCAFRGGRYNTSTGVVLKVK